MTKDELRELIEADNKIEREEKVQIIWEVRKDVLAYLNFKNMIDIGLTIKPSDISFERAMIFAWIKEELDGGKTRI